MTDEARAKIAALTHEMMELVDDLPDDEVTTVLSQLEEWHDHYRWLDGTDVCDRLDYAVTLTVVEP